MLFEWHVHVKTWASHHNAQIKDGIDFCPGILELREFQEVYLDLQFSKLDRDNVHIDVACSSKHRLSNKVIRPGEKILQTQNRNQY